MNMFHSFQARPWPAATAFALIVAAALLFVPVSYQKTVGQEATLTLGLPGLAPIQVQKIGFEFKTALHADDLSTTEGAGGGVILKIRVPGRSTKAVTQAVQAFADGLTSRGFPSTARVVPRTEIALGSLYAYAWDNIININVTSAGKTQAQIGAEIRDQLEAAGIENPVVQYEMEGSHPRLTVFMPRQASGSANDTSLCPDLNVTVDGREPGDAARKKYWIRVSAPGLTDMQIIAEVERQLREQGLDAVVTMEEGRIEIHPR